MYLSLFEEEAQIKMNATSNDIESVIGISMIPISSTIFFGEEVVV